MPATGWQYWLQPWACVAGLQRLLVLVAQVVMFLLRRLGSGVLWCMLQPLLCLSYGALDCFKHIAGLIKRRVQVRQRREGRGRDQGPAWSRCRRAVHGSQAVGIAVHHPGSTSTPFKPTGHDL